MQVTGTTDIGYTYTLDSQDPLAYFRDRFHFPQHEGKKAIYFCGNSLGLQPVTVEAAIHQELEDWRNLAVGGYFQARHPWLTYQHMISRPLSRIVGAREEEVTVMNALTVNLHLLMNSFYRPSLTRYKIIMEAGAFPSDQYAVETQVRMHGLEPESAIIEITPRHGEKCLREEDIQTVIEQHAQELALVMMGGINYYTGQLYPMQAITAWAHAAGALCAFDLAHVVGNVPVQLHDWGVDFAVWCTYKYLNAGPGAVGGAFVHEKHAAKGALQPRWGGWWGNDEQTRFRMEKGFIPKADASGWNLSTNQVFNMVALYASLQYFEEAGMDRIRQKSVRLTSYLEQKLGELDNLRFEIITPADPDKRGAQLSLYFPEQGKAIQQRMLDSGIIVDYREPGVIRVAPAPLYNSFEDVYRFCEILRQFQ